MVGNDPPTNLMVRMTRLMVVTTMMEMILMINLLRLASLPLCSYNTREFVILSTHSCCPSNIYHKGNRMRRIKSVRSQTIAESSSWTIMLVRISNRTTKWVSPRHPTRGEHWGSSWRPPRVRLRVVVTGVGVGVCSKPLR